MPWNLFSYTGVEFSGKTLYDSRDCAINFQFGKGAGSFLQNQA
jgi:hypothetical protein